MMKKGMLLFVVLCLSLALVACGGEKAEPTEESQDTTYTGILEEKKEFMIIVTSEDGTDAYAFNLEGDVTCEAEVGDKVTVTYTGDIRDFDAQLMAEKIEKVTE